MSLIEAQRNYQEFGASEGRKRDRASLPLPDDFQDPGWRPISLELDNFPQNADRLVHPRGIENYYYWRDTFWRKRKPRQKDDKGRHRCFEYRPLARRIASGVWDDATEIPRGNGRARGPAP